MGGRHQPTILGLVEAMRAGHVERVAEILATQPAIVDAKNDGRGVLHLATDWPGNWPRIGETIALLCDAGADVNARFPHPNDPEVAETPLHWAASSGDVAAVEALLERGAVVDALGGIFGGCTPFEEAVIFDHLDAARVLLERGAAAYLPGAAALGRFDLVRGYFDEQGRVRLDIGKLPHWDTMPPAQILLDRAFQFTCRSGHLAIARFLLQRGADLESLTPANTSALDLATQNGHADVVAWIRRQPRG